MFEKAQTILSIGDETFLKGVMCVCPEIPFTRWGIALNPNDPAKKSNSKSIFHPLSYISIYAYNYAICKMRIELVNRRGSFEKTAQVLVDGGVGLVTVPAVFGLVCDAGNKEASLRMAIMKGQRNILEKPFGIVALPDDLVSSIDVERVPVNLRTKMTDPIFFKSLTAVSFVRLPVRPDAKIPKCALSGDKNKPVVQFFVAHENTFMGKIAQAAKNKGVEFLAGTSANTTKAPEIVWLWSGLWYGLKQGVEIALIDPRVVRPWSRFYGSYPIIEVNENGPRLLRHGTVQVETLREIWNEDITIDENASPRNRTGGEMLHHRLSVRDGDLHAKVLVNLHKGSYT